MTVPLLSLASSVSAKTHCDIFVGHRVLNWTRMRIWPSLVLLGFYWVWQEPVCHFLLCYVLSWNSLHGSWSSMEGEPGTSCDPPIICSQSIYERPYDLPLFSLVSAGLRQGPSTTFALVPSTKLDYWQRKKKHERPWGCRELVGTLL
jgi:hypothetical protein